MYTWLNALYCEVNGKYSVTSLRFITKAMPITRKHIHTQTHIHTCKHTHTQIHTYRIPGQKQFQESRHMPDLLTHQTVHNVTSQTDIYIRTNTYTSWKPMWFHACMYAIMCTMIHTNCHKFHKSRRTLTSPYLMLGNATQRVGILWEMLKTTQYISASRWPHLNFSGNVINAYVNNQ